MRVIYKYRVMEQMGSCAILDLPTNTKIVLAGPDPNGELCVWIELDPDDAKAVKRQFRVVGTGHPIEDDLTHVSSFVQRPYVWHVYERRLS